MTIMENKQRTALQEVIGKIKEQIELHNIDLDYYKNQVGSIMLKQRYENVIFGLNLSLTELEKHLELEKQQIVDAYNEDLYGGVFKRVKYNDGEQYFIGTYEQ